MNKNSNENHKNKFLSQWQSQRLTNVSCIKQSQHLVIFWFRTKPLGFFRGNLKEMIRKTTELWNVNIYSTQMYVVHWNNVDFLEERTETQTVLLCVNTLGAWSHVHNQGFDSAQVSDVGVPCCWQLLPRERARADTHTGGSISAARDAKDIFLPQRFVVVLEK